MRFGGCGRPMERCRESTALRSGIGFATAEENVCFTPTMARRFDAVALVGVSRFAGHRGHTRVNRAAAKLRCRQCLY